MSPIREPKTLAAATRLLEDYAELDGQIAAIEANRQQCIAEVNARCDTAANDLIDRRARVAEKIAIWWGKEGDALLPDGRKTMELGGCIIGARLGKPSLAVACSDDIMVERLDGKAWAEGLLRVKVTLDKRAILKALEGPHRVHLGEAGFSINAPAAEFVLERAQQAGTRGGAGK